MRPRCARARRSSTASATFLTEHVDPRQIERDARIPDEVLRGLKDLGALGMKIPEEYGGLGLSQVYYNKALAMAGTWHASISTLLSAHQSIGLPEPLRGFGSEEQKREWLPKLARDHVSAFLLTEPDVGSDPARMSTTAVPTDDGTGYRISGTKLWATNGAIADVVVVMAVVPRSEGHRGGITAFICPCDRDGVTVEHRNAFMGLRGIENSVTRFDDVFIPTEDVIGGEGKGLRIALTTLNTGRLSLPAFCSSAAKYSLKIAREWSSERKQWGQPIGKHDPIAQKLAWLAGTAFGLEAMLDVSSRLADDKRNDIRIEAALAKLYGSELGWTAVDEMVQIRGGRAYETAESLARRGEKPVPAEQMLRDMRINRIFEGSTEIMHLLIAREAVDQHLQVAGDIVLGDLGIGDRAKAARQGGRLLREVVPDADHRRRAAPRLLRRVRRPGQAPALRRALTRASSRARPSTRWAATRRASSRRGTCSAGSSTSAPSCTRSRAPASTPTPSPGSGPTAGRRRSSWPTCSAARPAAGPTGSSTSCGPTTTTPSTGPRSKCCRAATHGSRTTCSTRPARAR